MKSLALQPWKWFSSQWGLPSANQLCATEKPLNIFGPLYCGDNVSESKLWSRWTHPSLSTSPISHPSSSSSSLFLSYLLPQHFLQYFFPVCRGGNSSSLNLSRGNLTARLQRLIGSNQDYWLPLCQNTFIHSHCWLLPSLARQQTPNDTLAEARRRSWGQRGRHSAAGGMVRAVCFSLMWAAVNDLGSSDETANTDGSKNIFFPCSNISLYLDQWW